MGFFEKLFKRSPAETLPSEERGGEGSGGVATSDMDENDTIKSEDVETVRGGGVGQPGAVEGPMGMQHFGYKTVSGMGERGGVDYSDSRLKGEAYIAEQKKLMKEADPDDQARIRRANERIAAVRRDLNRS